MTTASDGALDADELPPGGLPLVAAPGRALRRRLQRRPVADGLMIVALHGNWYLTSPDLPWRIHVTEDLLEALGATAATPAGE